MNPEKAYKLGVDPADVRIGCWRDRYSGDWVVYAPDPERGERVLTQNKSPYKAAHWLADLKAMASS